jgi:hypothetical protein
LRYTVRLEIATLAARHRNQERVIQNGSAWVSLYNDAVAELDPITLLKKIEAAQRAIINRLDDAVHAGI